jgi:hypothetical protein
MHFLKSLFLSICFSFLFLLSHAQSNNDFMVSGNMDIIKTDYSRFFDKAQLGIEGHYFVVRHFAASAGFEIWTQDKSSFMMGMRWYPQDHFFVRVRGLIGQNDVAIGGGWAKPINETWVFEAMGDFYLDQTEFGIRAGVSYIIKNKTIK